jgi:hypothetical protein
MAAQNCQNCGTCTCTGTYIVSATNGTPCCSACVASVNQKIAEGQIIYPKK